MAVVPKQEPVRKNLYEILKYNMEKAGRTNFLHRIIYIGRHKFPEDEILKHFDRNMKEVHSGYYDEKLTGILLYYPSYFCHILDGSEGTIFKHISLLLKNEATKEFIGPIKVLVFYHHINQRFRANWIGLTARPQTLFEKIDRDSNIEKTTTRIKTCLRKMYNLALNLRPKPKNTEQEEDSENEDNDEDEVNLFTVVTPDCLPEYAMLDFLIETKFTYPIQYFNDIYGKVPLIADLKDFSWPVPTDFVPLHLFDKYIDPIPDIKLPDNI